MGAMQSKLIRVSDMDRRGLASGGEEEGSHSQLDLKGLEIILEIGSLGSERGNARVVSPGDKAR
jgi:hypothetical protein